MSFDRKAIAFTKVAVQVLIVLLWETAPGERTRQRGVVAWGARWIVRPQYLFVDRGSPPTKGYRLDEYSSERLNVAVVGDRLRRANM